MTQKDKAKEIGRQWYFDTMNPNEAAYRASIQMAKWKEQQMIKKACEWLKSNTDWDDEWDDMGRNMNYGMIEEFRKAMEE